MKKDSEFVVFGMDGIPVTKAESSARMLEALQREVGGFIQVLRPPPGVDLKESVLVCNEDARFQGLQPNPMFPFLLGPVVVLREDALE